MDICYSCFRKKQNSGPCIFCGYDPDDDSRDYPLALKRGAVLNGKYILGRILGQGGFGITYVAWDDQRKELVAVKEYLPTDFAGRMNGYPFVQVYTGERQEYFTYGKEQFLMEAKTLSAFIGNNHIVRIHSYFEENGTAYFSMEYVDGLPLDKYMAQNGGRLSVEEASRLLLPLMDSMDQIHAKGIVHRDIAPDNIIIQRDGTAKLIDFGAARYSTGEKSKSLDVILKHGFAPKEQYSRHGRQGAFTDVYAMGATYYYALTGRVPPDSIDRMDSDDLVAPSTLGVKISSDAEEALLKALAVNAADRFQSMGDFHNAMRKAEIRAGKRKTEAGEAERQKRENEARLRREAEEKTRADAERRPERDAKQRKSIRLRSCGIALADGFLTAAAWLDGRSTILHSLRVGYSDKRRLMMNPDEFGYVLGQMKEGLQDKGYDWNGNLSLSVPDCFGNLEVLRIRETVKNCGFYLNRVISESEAAAMFIDSTLAPSQAEKAILCTAIDGFTSISLYEVGDGVIDAYGRYFPNGESREDSPEQRMYHQKTFQKDRDWLLGELFTEGSEVYLLGERKAAERLYTELRRSYVSSSSNIEPSMRFMMREALARGTAIKDATLTGELDGVVLIQLAPPFELYITVNGKRYELFEKNITVPSGKSIVVNAAGSTVIKLCEKHGEKQFFELGSCVLMLSEKGENLCIKLDFYTNNDIYLTASDQSGKILGKLELR